MDNSHSGPRKEKPDPQRMAVLRSLPLEIKEQITGEEAQAFLYSEELPESLFANVGVILLLVLILRAIKKVDLNLMPAPEIGIAGRTVCSSISTRWEY